MSLTDKYYLTIRPLSMTSEDTEDIIKDLSLETNIDEATLRLKLTGMSPDILKIGFKKDTLLATAAILNANGINSTVIHHRDLRNYKDNQNAKSVTFTGSGDSESINLISAENSPLCTITKNDLILIVAGTSDKEAMNRQFVKNTRNSYYGLTTNMEKQINELFLSQPIIDIYNLTQKTSARINARRFNAKSVDEKALSVNRTVKTLLEKIKKASKNTLLVPGFGENSFPFMPLMTEKNIVKCFSLYSRFIYLATTNHIFRKTTINDNSFSLIPIVALGGILFGGPLLPEAMSPLNFNMGGYSGKGQNKRQDISNKNIRQKTRLPFPPTPPTIIKHKFRGLTFGRKGRSFSILNIFSKKRRNLRKYGNPTVISILSFLTISGIGLAATFEKGEPLIISLFFSGVFTFIVSITMRKRKQSMTLTPTSNIKTMAMGQIEVKGRAKNKYLLNSPFTGSACAYYSYKIYDTYYDGKNRRTVLIEEGSSDMTPFYIEDDTGRVLVDPRDAIIQGGQKDKIYGSSNFHMASMFHFATLIGKIPSDGFAEEITVPQNSPLYVQGFATHNRISTNEKKKAFREKVRELKRDKNRLMAYDANNDGKIDENEWSDALQNLEEEHLMETLNKKKQDPVVIKSHPTDDIFFISDKQEEHLIKSLTVFAFASFIYTLFSVPSSIYLFIQHQGFYKEAFKFFQTFF